jgi:hypothetical protein
MPTLTARDQKKVDTFAYHEPKPAELFEHDAIGSITIFKYVPNAKGTSLKTASSGVSIRFQRGTTEAAIKAAKKVVKELNAGTYSGPSVICVPTGRPAGRPARA